MSGDAKIIEVIVTTIARRGSGKSGAEPIRVITQYWDKDGNLLAEVDPYAALAFEQLAAAGDQLAHNLTYEQNAPALESWWLARGGHGLCTVCRSQKPRHHCPETPYDEIPHSRRNPLPAHGDTGKNW
jgi:hypothetical protein